MLNFFAQRRFNCIDVVAEAVATTAIFDGSYFLAALVFVGGIVVGVIGEYFLHDKQGRQT